MLVRESGFVITNPMSLNMGSIFENFIVRKVTCVFLVEHRAAKYVENCPDNFFQNCALKHLVIKILGNSSNQIKQTKVQQNVLLDLVGRQIIHSNELGWFVC